MELPHCRDGTRRATVNLSWKSTDYWKERLNVSGLPRQEGNKHIDVLGSSAKMSKMPECRANWPQEAAGVSAASRRFSRYRYTATKIQSTTNARLMIAYLRTPKPSTCTITNVAMAENMSPARQKNVSTACNALYFASRLVGRKSARRKVFCNE